VKYLSSITSSLPYFEFLNFSCPGSFAFNLILPNRIFEIICGKLHTFGIGRSLCQKHNTRQFHSLILSAFPRSLDKYKFSVLASEIRAKPLLIYFNEMTLSPSFAEIPAILDTGEDN
jgi:hypothetical protein